MARGSNADVDPVPSGHVVNERLVQFGLLNANAVEMWKRGLPLVDHSLEAVEARYDPVHEVVLVKREDNTLATAIKVHEGTRQQLREAVARAVQFYGDEPLNRGQSGGDR